MNPYASESANRFSVKSAPKPDPATEGIDNPLMEGKKLDMSHQELKNFTKAMEQQEFRGLLHDYVNEISDPKNRPEYE